MNNFLAIILLFLLAACSVGNRSGGRAGVGLANGGQDLDDGSQLEGSDLDSTEDVEPGETDSEDDTNDASVDDDVTVVPAVVDPLPNDTLEREAWLRRQVARGGTVVLPAADFVLRQALDLPSNLRLEGQVGTVIYLQTNGFFTNQNPSIIGDSNSVGIRIQGRQNVVVHNLTIRLMRVNGNIAENRFVRGITVRNSSNVTVTSNDLAEFSLANGIITVDSSSDVYLGYNNIHDCYSNYTGGSRGQITGITVDDNRINGVASTRMTIERNVIRRLAVGSDFEARWGYETDGINVAGVLTSGLMILNNDIHDVGEGIDVFGSQNTIRCNEVQRARLFGIKLVHGASDNNIIGNRLVSSGMAEIVIAGSAVACNGAMRNYVFRNELRGVQSVGVLFVANGGDQCPGSTGRPINNSIEENAVLLSGPVEFAVTNGYQNNFRDNMTNPQNFTRPCN